MQIEKGSFVVVLGHNGSGKSTLAKTFNAVLLPSGGKVYVQEWIPRMRDCFWRSASGWAWCSRTRITRLLPMWWEEDVAFAPENLGVPTEEIRKKVDDALAAVRMSEFVTHAPHLLSGGQKATHCHRWCDCYGTRLYCSGRGHRHAGPVGRQEVLSTIHRLNREKHITVVLITHHMNEAEQADRVLVMKSGKVAMDGAPREVFSQVEALRDMGLTVPDTVDLLDRLRHRGVDVPLDALSVEECADAIAAALQ